MLVKADQEIPSFLKDEKVIKKIENKHKMNSKVIIKGLQKEEKNEFEILKEEADNLFKKKQFDISADKYRECIQKIESLSENNFLKTKLQDLLFKGNHKIIIK